MVNKKAEFLSNCAKSVSYFIESCCKIKHASMGVLPFKLFDYQKECLKAFKAHRFNIFKKNRQCGVSTLVGAYVLWYALFQNSKTVLILSKRDFDAMDFLAKNVKFMYDNLPPIIKEWRSITTSNGHEVEFSNGSIIRSMTSSKETMRSYSSSLNIIDEAAFVEYMDDIWTSGWSTMQHGGKCIVVSTPNGLGDWYYDTWTDAIAGKNDFNPIEINWWDMKWVLEWTDPVSKQHARIAPTEGIRPCETKEDLEKYGPYWSPWLEEQYRGLMRKGEGHKFKQEVVAEFLGSGNTILSTASLRNIEKSVTTSPEAFVVKDIIQYTHPVTGDAEDIDFNGAESDEGLWLWPSRGNQLGPDNKPIPGPIIATDKNAKIPSHAYVLGADVATGQDADYSTIQIFDVTTMEQVAEYMGRVKPSQFCRMIDWIGRWFNNAMVCVESTGIGNTIINDDLPNLYYPNLWRRDDKSKYGFATSSVGKPTLNRVLCESFSEIDGEGYLIRSSRLLKQLQMYIRFRTRHGYDTGKTGAQRGKGNHDDLVIAAALALQAAPEAVNFDTKTLFPHRIALHAPSIIPLTLRERAAMQKEMVGDDPNLLMPFSSVTGMRFASNPEIELQNFTAQVASSKQPPLPAVVHKKPKLII